jgi:hypothetical protein
MFREIETFASGRETAARLDCFPRTGTKWYFLFYKEIIMEPIIQFVIPKSNWLFGKIKSSQCGQAHFLNGKRFDQHPVIFQGQTNPI